MKAGRPRKWVGEEIRQISIYIPGYLVEASRELGFKTPSDAFYSLLKDKILNNGSSLKDRFVAQETFLHPVKPDGSEKITLDSQTAALDQYIKSLLPSQVASLRLKAERGDTRDLVKYQVAIEEKTGIWVMPSVFLNRFYSEEKNKEVNYGSTEARS